VVEGMEIRAGERQLQVAAQLPAGARQQDDQPPTT